MIAATERNKILKQIKNVACFLKASSYTRLSLNTIQVDNEKNLLTSGNISSWNR